MDSQAFARLFSPTRYSLEQKLDFLKQNGFAPDVRVPSRSLATTPERSKINIFDLYGDKKRREFLQKNGLWEA